MHPFLPKLKETTDPEKMRKLAGFDERGAWRVGSNIELSDLSDSLEIDSIDQDFIEVDSIPDIWARPLLFEMAFFDESHLLHSRVIAEWRGLLAMLALKEIRGLPMDSQTITIPNPLKTEVQDEQELVDEIHPFLKALSDLAPQHFIDEKSDWYQIYVLLFDGQPIGMTSPTTLVCTSVNYLNRIRNVPWFDGRLLGDPKPYLNDYEKQSLISWLEHARTELNSLGRPTTNDPKQVQDITQKRNDLTKRIDNYQDDLGRGQRVDEARLSTSGLHLKHGIFTYIDKPIRPSDDDAYGSHVLLEPSRKPAPEKALLVIDKKIAADWNMVEQDVVVIGSTTLNSIPYSGLGKDQTMFGNRKLQGAEWVTPDMFFTEMIYFADREDAFPGSRQVLGMQNLSFENRLITPILPVQSWLLDYLSLDDLAKRFSFEKTNDGILARLRVRLRGPKGNGRDFDLTKEYRIADNELHELESLPVLEIWPNFKAADWQAYYTYYSREFTESTFYAAPLTPGAAMETQNPQNKDAFKHKLPDGGVFIECKTPNRGKRLENIRRLSVFPEAFQCFYEKPDTKRNRFDVVTAGLILLQQPVSKRQTEEWKIGIDFGTTGTNVYYEDGNQKPKPFQFDEHYFRVTNSIGDARDDTFLYRFVAGNNAVTPFLTLYQDFQIADPTEYTLKPLLEGHIFFKNKITQFNVTDPDMHTNLKWGQTREDRKRTEAFLTQLCLQCAAEAVSKGAKDVEWRYSFPTAFSAGETRQFKGAWNIIVEECAKLTGLGSDKPIAKTESVASGQFFADNPTIENVAPFGSTGVCLDIGGATSDLSVWHDYNLRWQSSIRFAGRDIMLNLFYANRALLAQFVQDKGLSTNAPEEDYYTHLDVLLKEQGGEWLRHLHSSAAEPMIIGFLQLIALSLSGITFYMGQVLGALSRDKDISFPQVLPNVFVGGNGSRMFDWLAGGSTKYDTDSPISRLFKAMLLAGSGFKTEESKFKICTSPNPKSEVAYGLVSTGAKFSGIDQLDSGGVISGEDFIVNDKTQKWHTKLNADRLHQGVERPVELTQFTQFLRAFQERVKSPDYRDIIKPIRIDDSIHNVCSQALDKYLVAAKASETEEVHVEPLFIVILKHLIRIKTNEWAKTQQPV